MAKYLYRSDDEVLRELASRRLRATASGDTSPLTDFGRSFRRALVTEPRASYFDLFGEFEKSEQIRSDFAREHPIEEGIPSKAGSILGSIAPSIGAVGAIVFPEPVTSAAGVAVLSHYVAQAFGQGRQEVHKAREGGTEISGAKETAVALGYGLAVGIPEAIGLKGAKLVARRIPLNNLFKIGKAIQGNDAVKAAKLLKSEYITAGLKTSQIEGGEEWLEQVLTNSIDNLYKEQNMFEGGLQAYGYGTIGGSLLGPVGVGARRFKDRNVLPPSDFETEVSTGEPLDVTLGPLTERGLESGSVDALRLAAGQRSPSRWMVSPEGDIIERIEEPGGQRLLEKGTDAERAFGVDPEGVATLVPPVEAVTPFKEGKPRKERIAERKAAEAKAKKPVVKKKVAKPKKVVTPKVTAKQPHEMTKDEFVISRRPKHGEKYLEVGKGGVSRTHIVDEAHIKEMDKSNAAAHKRIVEIEAKKGNISEGIKDYPDLKPAGEAKPKPALVTANPAKEAVKELSLKNKARLSEAKEDGEFWTMTFNEYAKADDDNLKSLGKAFGGKAIPLEVSKLKREYIGYVESAIKEGEPVQPEILKQLAELKVKPAKIVITPGEKKAKPTAKVYDVEISSINTDVDRFQNRPEEFSEETVEAIQNNYDPNLFDPVVLWKDPKDGSIYVISGHSRLEGMTKRGEKTIPSRYFEGDEQKATNFAIIEANRASSDEPLKSTLKAYERAKKQLGSDNKIITLDKLAELKKRAIEKSKQLQVGLDPETLWIHTQIAMFHIEAGVRRFADFSTNMITDFGDVIKPHLRQIYLSAKDRDEMKEFLDDMDDEGAIKAWEDENIEPAKKKAEKVEKYEVITGSTGISKRLMGKYGAAVKAAPGTTNAEMIRKVVNERLYLDVPNIITTFTADPRPLKDLEIVSVNMYHEIIKDDYNKLVREAGKLATAGNADQANAVYAKADSMYKEFMRVNEFVVDISSPEAGKALQAISIALDEDFYTPASMLERASAIKAVSEHGAKLAEAEIKSVTDAANNIQDKQEIYEARLEEHEARIDELEKVNAGLQLKEEVRRIDRERKKQGRTRTKENILKEREQIKADMVKLGFRMNDIIGLSIEGSYLTGKLAVNYIHEGVHEGVVTLQGVVDKVLADSPDLTTRDVYEALNARNPNIQKKAKSANDAIVRELKKEAGLEVELQDAENGIFKETKARKITSDRAKRLQDAIKKLKDHFFKTERDGVRLQKILDKIAAYEDMIYRQYRVIRKPAKRDPEVIKVAKQCSRDIHSFMNAGDKLADIERQAASGDFRIDENLRGEYKRQREKVVIANLKKTFKPGRPKREQPQSVIDAKIDLQTARQEGLQLLRTLEALKWKRKIVTALGVFRTALASGEMSWILRQAVAFHAPHPIVMSRVVRKSVGTFFSEYTAERIDAEMHEDPRMYHAKKHKLAVLPLKNGVLTEREEDQMGAEPLKKIPYFGRWIRASERNMIVGLNMVRTEIFYEFMRKNPNATSEELDAYAEITTIGSGRGNLGTFTYAGMALSLAFFAPRFAVSRIQLPFMLAKHWKHKRVRKELIKDFMINGATAFTVLNLAAMAGATVDWDPESSDFLKIKKGNTRYDIFGGGLPLVRLFGRLFFAITNRVGITGKYKPEYATPELKREFTNFILYKLNPVWTYGHTVITGKNIIGQEQSPLEATVRAMSMLFLQEAWDVGVDQGIGSGITAGALAGLGVGVQNYEKNVVYQRRIAVAKIKSMVDAGAMKKAKKTFDKWNDANSEYKLTRNSIGRSKFRP